MIQSTAKESKPEALVIAADPQAEYAVVCKFSQVDSASAAQASKESRLKLWLVLAKSIWIDPSPVTNAKILQYAATLREAGFCGGHLYVIEAVADARQGFERDLAP